MSSHSNIGPSSAERWIACPGSVALSAQCPKSPANIYSAEGVVAHSLAEMLVTEKIDDLELMSRIGSTVHEEGFDIEITDEMTEGIMLYRDTIAADYSALARLKKNDVHRKAEVKVHIKSISEDLWGTADFLLFQKGNSLKVYDFKFGRGVVEAQENPQMALYGLGAMETIAGEAYDEVELIIVQPRAGHADGAVRRWKAPLEWLAAFRAKAHQAVQETKNPNARIVPGDHCKWCPAKVACPALYKAAQDQAGVDFDIVAPTETKDTESPLPNVKLMTMEKLAQAYGWREAIESWFSDVADRIRETLESGEHVPGYKLVDGRSNRKWIDEEKVVEEWQALLPEGALFEHKLLSPAKLEKLPGVGKGKIDHLTFKPEAKKAIARDVDPRPRAASKAQDDFGVLDDTNVLDRNPIDQDAGFISQKMSRDAKEYPADDLDAELLGVTSDASKKRDPLWPV